MLKWGCALSGLLIGAGPALALPQAQSAAEAQQAAGADDNIVTAGEGEDIVVTGAPQRGAVPGDIPPEEQLGPAEIRSYGVSSISDLLSQLAPQTASARGRGDGMPVVLLNGRRISSFREIRDIPTEAIERVDILPEEAALKLGYKADQRVVNFVLRQRFHSITAEAGGSMPTAGGRTSPSAQLDILHINRDGRVNVDVKYTSASQLLESERNVQSATSSPFDFQGNITGINGGEIDPALSAAAGAPADSPVTVAGVPGSALTTPPTLASFVPGAGKPNQSNIGAYRTLSPATHSLAINSVLSRALSQKVTATANVAIEISDTQSLLGPASGTLTLPAGNPWSPFANDVQLNRYYGELQPLDRNSTTRTAHLGFSLNGDIPNWRWSLAGTWEREITETASDTGVDVLPLQAALDAGLTSFNPYGPIPNGLVSIAAADRANSTSTTGSLDALLAGSLFSVPAGKVSTSFKLSGDTSDFATDSFRLGMLTSGKVARDSVDGKVNVDVPITSRRRDVLAAIGDLSLNGNIELEHLSDFGTLTTIGYGLNWAPISEVRLLVSATDEDGAPTAQQLGDAVLVTPNRRVFDYVRGESVDVTAVTGGNPTLSADNRHVLKVGLTVRPFEKTDVNFRADYVRSTIRDAISTFPSPSAAIETAFPDRFLRDGEGQLIRVDQRPINFARTESQSLRWGVNLSMPIKSTAQKRIQAAMEARRKQIEEARAAGKPVPPPDPSMFPFRGGQGRRGQGDQGDGAGQGGGRGFGQGGDQGGGQGGQGGGFRAGGGGRGGGFGARAAAAAGPNGPLAGRIMFNLYHTWHIRETVLIRDGLPELDLLHGAATGNQGGEPQHEIQAQLGANKDGFGLWLNANWQSATDVKGGTIGSSQELHFGDLATFDLRMFANLAQQLSLVRKHPWMRGMRITLGLKNIFDARMHVTDANGTVPLSYQPDLIDPLGRTVSISVRKLFF